MSSCPEDQPDVEELRAKREEEVYQKSKELFKMFAVNMCIPEGISGNFDIAFKVDRQKQIARALRDVAKELE